MPPLKLIRILPLRILIVYPSHQAYIFTQVAAQLPATTAPNYSPLRWILSILVSQSLQRNINESINSLFRLDCRCDVLTLSKFLQYPPKKKLLLQYLFKKKSYSTTPQDFLPRPCLTTHLYTCLDTYSATCSPAYCLTMIPGYLLTHLLPFKFLTPVPPHFFFKGKGPINLV